MQGLDWLGFALDRVGLYFVAVPGRVKPYPGSTFADEQEVPSWQLVFALRAVVFQPVSYTHLTLPTNHPV